MEFKMKWIVSVTGILLSSISMIVASGIHPHPDPGGTKQPTTELYNHNKTGSTSLHSSLNQNIENLQFTKTFETTDRRTHTTRSVTNSNLTDELSNVTLQQTPVPQSISETSVTIPQYVETEKSKIKYNIPNEKVISTVDPTTLIDKTSNQPLAEFVYVTQTPVHESISGTSVTIPQYVETEKSTTNYNIPNEKVISTVDPTTLIDKTSNQPLAEFVNVTSRFEKTKDVQTTTIVKEIRTNEKPGASIVTTAKSDQETFTTAAIHKASTNVILGNQTDLLNTPTPDNTDYETQIATELITRTELVTSYITPTKLGSVKDETDLQKVKEESNIVRNGTALKTVRPNGKGTIPMQSFQDDHVIVKVGTTPSPEVNLPETEHSVITSPPTAHEFESKQEITSLPWEKIINSVAERDILAQQTTTDSDGQQSSSEGSVFESEFELTEGISTSTDTRSNSLQTIPTEDEYVTGVTTIVYTSKEHEYIPRNPSSHVQVRKRTTIQEPDLKFTPPPPMSRTNDVSDSVTLITSIETVPMNDGTKDIPADLMVTYAYKIVTEFQTVVETTMVPAEVIVITPPRLITISTVTAYSTKVTWRAPGRPVIRHFRVEYTGTFTDKKITVITVGGRLNNKIIDGLTAGERYRFRVSSVPVSGTASDWSNIMEADTVMVPVVVSVESIQERSVTLSWRDNPNVAIRETRINYQGTSQDRQLKSTIISNFRTTTLRDLYPGDLYEIEVTVFSPTNKQAVTKIQVGTRPFPPTLEPISYYNVSSIEIGVKPPTNSIVHSFNVSIQLQNTTEFTYFHVLNLGSSVTNFVIPSLVSGGQYEISIACIGYGFHEYSRWTRIKHTAKLYAPMIQIDRTVVTTTSINFFWEFRDYIDCSHFLITYYAKHGGIMNRGTMNCLKKSAQLQNLVPGETYTMIVKAVSGPEFASSQPINITTSLGQLRVEPVTMYTATTVTLSWVTSAPNAIIETFVVTYKGTHLDRQPSSINVPGIERTYVLSRLAPGETYSINVQARSGRQYVDGNSISKTTVPSNPFDIDAPHTTMDTIHLSWEKSAYSVVETYEIKYHNTGDKVVREGVSSTEGYVMKSLKPGAVYSISIRALSGSEKSREVTTIQRTKLGQASEIRVNALTNTSFAVLWEDPPGSYEGVAVTCDKCATRQLNIFYGGMSVARFKKLSAGTKYRVSLVTKKSDFEDSHPAVIEVITNPHSPEYLHIVSYSKTDVTFAWVDNDCTSCFYRVQCVAYVDGWSINDDLWHNNVSAHQEYTCNGLVPGELYTISVTSLISNDLTIKPPPLVMRQRTEPAMPNDVSIITRTAETVSLAWERAEGIFDYYTTRLVSSRHIIVANYTPEVTSIDRKRLDPYLGYDFYISTVSGKLISETRHIHFNTREGRPGQVSRFKLVPVNPTTISVHFEAPLEPNGRILGYTISYEGSAPNKKRTRLSETGEDRGRKKIPYNKTEGSFSELRPGYMYSFSIVAETTVGYGPDLVKNMSTPIWSPRPTSIRPKGVQQQDLTSKSFPVDFDDSYFTDDYGEILYYSVIVAEAAAIVYDQQPESFDRPNVTMLTWSQAIVQDPIPKYQISEPIEYSGIRHDDENQKYTGSLRVQRSTKSIRIMIGSDSCSKKRHVYCNGPLSPGKTYVYNFRAYSEAGYTDTHFSSPISLPEDDGMLIIAVMCALIVLIIVVIILVVIFLRRNRKYGPDKPLLRRLSTHWSCKDDQDSPATPLVRCPNTKKYSRPVALSDFCHDYHEMIAHTHFGFSQEYESIQKVGKKLSWSAAVLPENVVKNRYSNILPYDRTRVKLSYIEGEEGTDYINASYIPGFTSPREFISCQGPLPGTIADMWRMIWELKISNLVMVTKLVERGKVRCDQYWPEDHKPVFFGDVIVTMTSKTETENCWHVREFMIQYGAKTRKIKHFHFLDWPDHGVPATGSPLIRFIQMVRLHIPDDNTPTLVHCSAGVGRTGTFICLDRLLQHIEEHDHVDIMGIVCEMRFHRSFMVQTEQQYIFIHKCLLDILEERRLTAKTVSSNGSLEHKV
ncbi:receptor-type tyrosine-protein phosphatase eta-like [Antedon mediterranea]|uniref:receptor-type tyrosine-protein phosphatase eta-like n=1 Tax=Antedon mediterranea TaxID=105859 RepID=UPI003AF51489